jgi:hypothetical protein
LSSYDCWTLAISAATSAAAIATLIVLLITLFKISDYVGETKKIAVAAIEQAEASQKPCLVVAAEPRSDLTTIMGAPAAMQIPPGSVRYINIGPGPAISIGITIEKKNGETWEPGIRLDLPYLKSAAEYEYIFAASSEVGVVRRLTAMYESMSGRGYLTVVELDGKVIIRLELRPARDGELLPTSLPGTLEQSKRRA